MEFLGEMKNENEIVGIEVESERHLKRENSMATTKFNQQEPPKANKRVFVCVRCRCHRHSSLET